MASLGLAPIVSQIAQLFTAKDKQIADLTAAVSAAGQPDPADVQAVVDLQALATAEASIAF